MNVGMLPVVAMALLLIMIGVFASLSNRDGAGRRLNRHDASGGSDGGGWFSSGDGHGGGSGHCGGSDGGDCGGGH